MNAKQAKYPQLRFNGFTDPWEQRKLGKIGKTFTGLSGKTKEDFGHGDAKFVTYMNVFSNPVSDLEMIDNIEVDAKQNSVEYGDVFFTTSSETPEEVGMSSVWLGNKDNVYLNSFSFGYRPDKIFAPYYLAFMLRSPVIRRKFMFLAQGISRYNISKTKAMNMEVPVPKLEEQKQIGDFFQQLDKTIALHQRKLAKLKELKQGYLQKLFPKNGSKFPQLRFAGFADAWEERKLGQYTKLITKGTTPKDKTGIGDVNFVKVENITNGKIYPINKIKQNEHDNYLKRSRLEEKDILFSIAGTLGRTAIVNKSILPANTNQALAIIRGYDFDTNFLITSLAGNVVKKYIRRNPTVGAQPNLSLEQVGNLLVNTPNAEEQQKIGSFFKQLDDTIALHQRKLEKLQELKKGYLQKMFC